MTNIKDKIEDYIYNNPIEIYIDYRDELSEDQVDKILEGKADEVIMEIEDYANHCSEPGEYDYYWEELKSELNCTQEDIDAYLEDGAYPSYWLTERDFSRLMSNTQAYIHVSTDIDFNLSDLAYGRPLEYRDVKDTLKLLDINPMEFRKYYEENFNGNYKIKGYFPNMPQRKPKVNYKDLWDQLICLYDGVVCFLLGDLEEAMQVAESDSKYITITKGTEVVMYDFGGGAGILETELEEDLVMRRKDVEIRNDKSFRYGIQNCYGFVNEVWTKGGIRNGK